MINFLKLSNFAIKIQLILTNSKFAMVTTFSKNKKFHFACFPQFFALIILGMSRFFGGKFKFAIANIFPAINLKTIKDDYSRKFAEIFEKVQKWSFLFRLFLL